MKTASGVQPCRRHMDVVLPFRTGTPEGWAKGSWHLSIFLGLGRYYSEDKRKVDLSK